MTRRLRPLAELTHGILDTPPEIVVTDVTLDSRAVQPGALFLACHGRRHLGLEFAASAIGQGARAVLFDSAAPEQSMASREGTSVAGAVDELKGLAAATGVFVAGVPGLSSQAGAIAARFFGSPSQSLTIAGITGTNGKTTSAFLLAQALQHCGRRCAYSGTLGYGFPNSLETSDLTTADAVSVQRQLARLRAQGAECVSMEVSSHALDQGRVSTVQFHTVAFTNLTRDHLDYHGTLEAYGAAKAKLFEMPALKARIVNVDDAFGAQLASRGGSAQLVLTTRTQPQTGRGVDYVAATNARAIEQGLSIDIESSWGSAALSSALIGDFNVDNLLTVLAVLLAWNIPLAEAVAALSRCQPPPGRMQTFGGGEQPLAIVDYAHTPDALAKALRASRAHCKGSLRVVFGCGGDRDRGKRSAMGKLAEELADEIVLTDDNPRGEDPRSIVQDIRSGMSGARPARVEHDRARAIASSLASSGKGDVVLIAGKGHESYQIYGAERRIFSDQAIVRNQLEKAGS